MSYGVAIPLAEPLERLVVGNGQREGAELVRRCVLRFIVDEIGLLIGFITFLYMGGEGRGGEGRGGEGKGGEGRGGEGREGRGGKGRGEGMKLKRRQRVREKCKDEYTFL